MCWRSAKIARFFIIYDVPSKHFKADQHRPDSETPFEWRFAGVPMVDPTLNVERVVLFVFSSLANITMEL